MDERSEWLMAAIRYAIRNTDRFARFMGVRFSSSDANRLVSAYEAVVGIPTKALGDGGLDEVLDAVYEIVACAKDQGDRDHYTFHENVIDPLVDALTKLQGDCEPGRHHPCGCILCICDDDEQCQGCGAKHCGKHPVGEFVAAKLRGDTDGN